MRISGTRWFAMALIAGMGASVSSLALAHVDVGVDIGVPGVVYAPQPVYAAPPPEYAPPPPEYAPPPQAAIVIAPGWYGDRYYDGHRYWERHDWEEHHHDWEEHHHGDRDWREARDYHGGYDHHDYDHHDGHRDGWHDHGGDGPHYDGHGDH